MNLHLFADITNLVLRIFTLFCMVAENKLPIYIIDDF